MLHLLADSRLGGTETLPAGRRVSYGTMTVESSGAGAVAGTASGARRRPGRPARIDRDSIVRAAVELAAVAGAEQITMTSVAERLGVAMPALYYHVSSREELLGLVGTSVLQRIAVPDLSAWDAWLLAFARALRARALQDPGLVNTTPITAHGLVDVPLVAGALERLVAACFSPTAALLAFDDVVATTIDSVCRD